MGRGDALRELKSAEWLGWPGTRKVFDLVAKGGQEARVVGGAVRNALIGHAVREVDFATTATPEQMLAFARTAGVKAVPTGIDHGTVTLVIGERSFEVTTLRKDVETYGRHAKVAFTDDWAADARRRDFTVNALYAAADGAVHDPLGGVADLEQRRIRFIGKPSERIREDYLRILRFFRFNAEYSSPPYDADGLRACVEQRRGLAQLSAERVGAEALRLLEAPGAMDAIAAMFDHGLLVDVLGSVPYLARLERLIALESALQRKPDRVLRLAALTIAVPEDAERMGMRLRLPNADTERLARAAGGHDVSHQTSAVDARRALYAAGVQNFVDRVLLAWAQSPGGPDNASWKKLLALPDRWPVPELPIRGKDVMALGAAKGPRVGEVLRAAERAWIESDFTLERDALLALVRGELASR